MHRFLLLSASVPNFIEIGGGSRKFSKKWVDLTRNDPNAHLTVLNIYTTKIDGVVCPPNISETVAGGLMKLAHRPRIASTMIKLISKPILLPILLILVKTIQRIVADPKPKLSPPFDSADSVPSLGHPAPGSGKMLSLFTVLCDYSVWVTETGAPGSGKTIQPIII